MFYLYRRVNNNIIMYFIVFIFTFCGLNIIPILHNNSLQTAHLNITKGKFIDLMTDKSSLWQNVEVIEILQINETDNTINEIQQIEHGGEESIIEISVRRRLRSHGHGHHTHSHGHTHGRNNNNNCKPHINC